MNKTMKNILLRIASVALVLCILWHTGNPANWLSARAKAADYLEQNYGTGYTFSCRYMQLSKVKGYKCTVGIPDTQNEVFYIYVLDNGEILG